MAPIVIDLLSESDSDKSPDKAASNAIRNFKPRKDKPDWWKSAGNGSSLDRRSYGLNDAAYEIFRVRREQGDEEGLQNARRLARIGALSTAAQRPLGQQPTSGKSSNSDPAPINGRPPAKGRSFAALMRKEAQSARLKSPRLSDGTQNETSTLLRGEKQTKIAEQDSREQTKLNPRATAEEQTKLAKRTSAEEQRERTPSVQESQANEAVRRGSADRQQREQQQIQAEPFERQITTATLFSSSTRSNDMAEPRELALNGQQGGGVELHTNVKRKRTRASSSSPEFAQPNLKRVRGEILQPSAEGSHPKAVPLPAASSSDDSDTSDASEVPSRPKRSGTIAELTTMTQEPSRGAKSVSTMLPPSLALATQSAPLDARRLQSRATQTLREDTHSQEETTKFGVSYSAEEDDLLANLREVEKLSWEDMLSHFNGRTKGSLQVRYYTKVARRSKATPANIVRKEEHQHLVRSSAGPEEQLQKRRKPVRRSGVAATEGFLPWSEAATRLLDDDYVGAIEYARESAIDPDRLARQDRAFPVSATRSLRQRELGLSGGRGWSSTSRGVSDELKNDVLDSLGPKKYFELTSGDVTCAAWSPNGAQFAAGSIATSDERSMQYNNSCNLLLGDLEHGTLRELPEHHVPRPVIRSGSGNVNALHAMRESQDRRLFMTVAAVGFSPDSATLYTGGHDRILRAYSAEDGVTDARCLFAIEHPARVDLLAVSNKDLVATACHHAGEGSVAVFRSANNGYVRQNLLSPSRSDLVSSLPIFPSALKFGAASQHSNLLLAGFSSDSSEEERGEAGEICLWDVRGAQRIELNVRIRNVFDVAWNPAPSSASTLFAVASTPGANKVNRGTRSIVQCFAPDQGRASAKLQWECPAFDINDVLYCPHDDNLIAAGATNGRAYVWDKRFADRKQTPLHVLAHGESVNVLDHDRDRELADEGVRFISWGATSSRLYTGASDGTVKVWNPYRPPDNAHVKDLATFSSAIMSCAFSSDYRELLVGEHKGRLNLLSIDCEGRSVRAAKRFELHIEEVKRRNTAIAREAANAQKDSAKAEVGRLEVEASLSQGLQKCTLDCNFIPVDVGEDGEVPDTRRSERRIPGALRAIRKPLRDVAELTIQEALEEGLNGICSACCNPTARSKSMSLLVCDACALKRAGFTGNCARCSAPVRPSFDGQAEDLCERCDFACFRCGGHTRVSSRGTKVTCKTCGLAWEADVLGYRLLGSKRCAKFDTGITVGQRTPNESTQTVQEYYASHWQVPLVDAARPGRDSG